MQIISGTSKSLALGAMEAKDFFNTNDDSVNYFPRSNRYAGQIFQASQSYVACSVNMLMLRDAVNPPGIVTAYLLGSDEPPDFPVLPILSQGTTDGDTLTTDLEGEWRRIAISPHIAIIEGQFYYVGVKQSTLEYAALGLRCEGEPVPDFYPTGVFCYGGAPTWYINESVDCLFEIWGY